MAKQCVNDVPSRLRINSEHGREGESVSDGKKLNQHVSTESAMSHQWLLVLDLDQTGLLSKEIIIFSDGTIIHAQHNN